MERDCVPYGTRVSSSGYTIMIEKMEKFSGNILGWSKSDNGIMSDIQTDFAYRGVKQCYKITLSDGRTVEATKNHPFLTSKGKWVEVRNLKRGDVLKCGTINGPVINFEEDIENCNGWEYSLGDYIFKTDTFDNLRKTLAFARILGWVVTDSHVPPKGNISMSLGHPMDVEWVLDDLRLLGMNRKYYKTKNYFSINLPTKFSNDLRSIYGVVVGSKVDKRPSLPKFIMKDCPLPILREFLASYFGADGITCHIGKRNDRKNPYQLKSIGLTETKIKRYVDALIEKFLTIKRLLEEFGIEGITINKPKLTQDSKKTGKDNWELVMNIPIEMLTTFYNKIGMRYCVHKIVRLDIGATYRRFIDGCIKQRMEIAHIFRDILPAGARGVEKSMALENAIAMFKRDNYLLHECSQPTNLRQITRLVEGKQCTSFKNPNFTTVDEHFKKLGCFDLLLRKNEGNKITYGVDIDKNVAPTYNLEILDIRESGMKDVYDITVMNSHSFLANGVVAHNCLLANGCPAFVKDRLMEQSDEYRMWFCKVCGLPAIVVKGSPELNIPPSKECRVCQSKNIAYVKLPYATKLLMYEFMGMGIVFRVLTDSFEDPQLEAIEQSPEITHKIREEVYKPAMKTLFSD